MAKLNGTGGRLNDETFGWICMMTKLWFGLIPGWHLGTDIDVRLREGGPEPSKNAIVWVENAEQDLSELRSKGIFDNHKTVWCRVLKKSAGAARTKFSKNPGYAGVSHILIRSLKGAKRAALCVSWVNFKI